MGLGTVKNLFTLKKRRRVTDIAHVSILGPYEGKQPVRPTTIPAVQGVPFGPLKAVDLGTLGRLQA